jgi:hypothetical protein
MLCKGEKEVQKNLMPLKREQKAQKKALCLLKDRRRCKKPHSS